MSGDRELAICGQYGCEEQAVAWVRFQAMDVERTHVRWFTTDSDMCEAHLAELEQDVDRQEAFVLEQIDYRAGSSYHQPMAVS
jgi:hypothetical protein